MIGIQARSVGFLPCPALPCPERRAPLCTSGRAGPSLKSESRRTQPPRASGLHQAVRPRPQPRSPSDPHRLQGRALFGDRFAAREHLTASPNARSSPPARGSTKRRVGDDRRERDNMLSRAVEVHVTRVWTPPVLMMRGSWGLREKAGVARTKRQPIARSGLRCTGCTRCQPRPSRRHRDRRPGASSAQGNDLLVVVHGDSPRLAQR